MRMFKIIDWYLMRKFLGTFAFAILILAVISCVIDYSEKVEDFVQKKAPLLAIMNYYKDFIPHITALLFPLFIFIATIFFTSKLAYKSEIIAMLAGGISFQRFLKPYIMAGSFLCAVSLVANHWIIPNADKERLAFENRYIHNPTYVSDRNVHIRLSKEQFVYMQSYDYMANMGYRFTAEKIDGTKLKEKLMADRVSYDSVKKTWHLYVVSVRNIDSLKETLKMYNDMEMKYAFSPKDLHEDEAIKEALTTTELNAYVAKEKLRGHENLNTFLVEKERRTAQPFAGLILTIIGACIASRKIRGGSGLHLALGILLSSLYIMLLQFSTTFSTKSTLNPLIAVWIPNVIFAIVALYLYRRQVK